MRGRTIHKCALFIVFSTKSTGAAERGRRSHLGERGTGRLWWGHVAPHTTLTTFLTQKQQEANSPLKLWFVRCNAIGVAHSDHLHVWYYIPPLTLHCWPLLITHHLLAPLLLLLLLLLLVPLLTYFPLSQRREAVSCCWHPQFGIAGECTVSNRSLTLFSTPRPLLLSSELERELPELVWFSFKPTANTWVLQELMFIGYQRFSSVIFPLGCIPEPSIILCPGLKLDWIYYFGTAGLCFRMGVGLFILYFWGSELYIAQ